MVSRLQFLLLDEGVREDLPGEQRLCDEAQQDIDALTKFIRLPRADAFILQHHIDGERVEAEKKRNDDPVDETGNAVASCLLLGVYKLNGNSDPRDNAHN